MSRASYYRDQAYVVLLWALAATDSDIKKRMELRAREYLELAAALEATQADQPPDDISSHS